MEHPQSSEAEPGRTVRIIKFDSMEYHAMLLLLEGMQSPNPRFPGYHLALAGNGSTKRRPKANPALIRYLPPVTLPAALLSSSLHL